MGVGRSTGSLSPRDFTIFADKLKSRYSWVFEFAESDLKALAPADDGENAEKVNTKAHSSCTMDATIHGNTAVSQCALFKLDGIRTFTEAGTMIFHDDS